MSKRFKILTLCFWLLSFVFVSFSPLFLGRLSASSLGPSSLFLETMQVDVPGVGFQVLVKPNTNFSSGGSLKISFPDSASGDWCKQNGQVLTTAGIASSEVGAIDSALPGTLVGTCYQNSSGDYVEITGIEALTGGLTYGVEVSGHANFSTGPDIGNNLVLFELTSGIKTESRDFSVYLVSNNKIRISAEVSDADSVICSISTSSVSMGVLYKGGAYITANHTLGTSTTGGSKGYYWTVFGTNAGLYNPNYLIGSLGSTVNLLTGEGFGLVINPNTGASVPSDFQIGPLGMFGSIKQGFDNARMILYRSGEQTNHEEATVTLGARASGEAVAGNYEEVLTYSCGGYVGGYRPLALVIDPTFLDFSSSDEVKTFTISNSGSGNLEWEIQAPVYDSGSGWVEEIDPVAGITRSSTDTIAVRVNRELIPEGNYSATLPITSLGGGNGEVLLNISKLGYLAVLTTTLPFDIYTTSAKSGGIITDDGGADIISRGVCYSTSENPTTPCTNDGIGMGEFSSTITPLESGTKYYVRAYAENSQGISYGNEYSFVTINNVTADPLSRDWSSEDIAVSLTASGSEISGIEYCWTTESSCSPNNLEVGNPIVATQTVNGIWNLCYRYNDLEGKKGAVACSGTYKLDNENPVLTFTNTSSPESYYNSVSFLNVTRPVKAQDPNHSGLKEFRYAWTASAVDPAGITAGACTGGTNVIFTEGTINQILSTAVAGKPTTSGIHYLHACAEDMTGNITKEHSIYYLDVDPPSGGSFVINNDDDYTTSPTGNTLNITCPTDSWAPIEMAYGNSANPINWTACTATVSNYDLGSGDGTKTVYMAFRDGGGNKTSDITDTIVLDTVVPTLEASNSSETWYNSPRTAVVTATDITSGIAEVRYSWGVNEMNEGCIEGGALTSHAGELDPPSGGTTLYLCVRDNAGHVTNWNGQYNWVDDPELGGYAWSDTSGWISFNCLNEEECSTSPYKVAVQGDSLVGKAWSDNIGWLMFDAPPDFTTGLYPESPQHSAKFDIDGTACGEIGRVCGWARFCSGTVNGDCVSATVEEEILDGWVKLGPVDLNYVEFDDASGEFTGSAWGTDSISFNCSNELECGTSPYKVRIYPFGPGLDPWAQDWTDQNVSITFFASDPEDAIARYKSCVTQGATCVPFVDGNSVLLTEDGEYTVCIKAQSTSGTWSFLSCSTEGAYKIDKTAPSDPNFVPFSQDWTAEDIFVEFSSTDAESGIQGYEYCTITGSNICTPDTAGDNVTLTGSGEHTICARAQNNAGIWSNSVCSIEGVFKLDNTAPDISASNSSETWYETERQALISASDLHLGLAEVRYSWGDVSEMNEACTVGGTVTTHGTALSAPEGGVTLFLCARDTVGNVATWNGQYNWTDGPELGGYAWSDDIGWISMNCLNENECATSDYRVTVFNENLIGYGWSENLGWLKFDPDPDFTTGLYPAEGPQHSAKLDFDGTLCGVAGRVCGWARFCSGTVNDDCASATDAEFDGWVKLGPVEGAYVEYDELTGEFTGYASSTDPISFNCSNETECATSFYKVRIYPFGPELDPWSRDWSTENVEVTFSASDPDPVVSFKYCVTSGRTCTPVVDGSSVLLSDTGAHTVCIKGLSSFGTWSFLTCSTQGAYKIDKTPPSDPGFVPSSQAWTAEDILVEFSATDAESGIQGYEYCTIIGSNICTPDTLGNNVTLTGTGQYTVCARAQNNADSWSNSVCSIEGAFKLDNTGPQLLASNASSTWYETEREAVISASDTNSGLAEVRYSWGTDEMNVACTTGGTVTTHSATLEAPIGGTTLYLCARDELDNVTTWNGTYNWGAQALEGYAWGDELGWISFNCSNHNGCTESNYRVQIQEDVLAGYAWSENTGWLRFDAPPDFTTGLYPESPQHSAKLDTDGSLCGAAGRVCGWARFCSATVNNDCESATDAEWDGWVKLGPVEGDYVTYDSLTGEFSGYGHILDIRSPGIISFNCADEAICSTSFYKVTNSFIESSEDCSIMNIGDECGGGKVAYLDGTGGGLIAAVTDGGSQWGCSGTSTGGTGTAIGVGANNTAVIVDWHIGWDEPWETGPNAETCSSSNSGDVAAGVCANLTTWGHEDWFLPSKDELSQLYTNRVAVGGFAQDIYFSSSESGSEQAWGLDFWDGSWFQHSKDYTQPIRCVRSFE